MRHKVMTVTVTDVHGVKTDTIVWGGDANQGQGDAASHAAAQHHEQSVLFTTSIVLPSGVRIDSIIWGS